MRRRVLIIDDEDDIREVIQVSMELLGDWDVITAASGTEGVARAAADQPDVILLDVMMPEMDGPSTLRMLRDDPATSRIPVILLTAKIQSADRAQLESLGAAGLLAKPFDPMLLSDDVLRILEHERDGGP